MNEKALKTLEYNKIIDQLTEYASTEMGKTLCRELHPSCNLEEIRRTQTETSDAVNRIRMKGSLSFGGVKDVRSSLKRLEIGSTLNIPELLDAGIDSFKVEGRMKTALYVATVARTYRRAIDDCLASVERYRENLPWYLEQITSCTYRLFTTGFFFGKPRFLFL